MNACEKSALTPEQLRQLQQKGLETAIYFRDFCQENSLTFFLCGGCCIGSQRNGGFIPWDDDVDVFMPRADYEKLARLWPEKADTTRFSYQAPSESCCTKNQFATIHHNQTTFIKSYQQELDINHGIMLDILPIDGCPESRLKRAAQKFWALLYSLMIVEAAPDNHGGAVRFLGKLLLFFVRGHKRRYHLAKRCERRMSKYPIPATSHITELCSGPHYMQMEYPAACFEKQLWVPFEGVQMPIPAGFDTYLTMAFGDWRTPPPKEKQSIQHDYVYIDTERPYTAFRGVYYLKNKLAGEKR